LSRFLAILLLLGLASSASLHAWGAEGHHVIARIALSRMTPAAQAGVAAVLGAEDLLAASVWADTIRFRRPATYNWHFVDIPFEEAHYLVERDCQRTPRGDCILAELDRVRMQLAERAGDQAEALKFLIHFIGDLHQPLHVTDNLDRGGNDVPVLLGGRGPRMGLNLHMVWDTTLIQQTQRDEEAYAARLIEHLTARPVEVHGTDFVGWAEETHKLGVSVAYAYPDFLPRALPIQAVTLSQAYQADAIRIIDRQLQVAGVRLAAVLNEVFTARETPFGPSSGPRVAVP
jgi:hypothetical protein